MLGWLGRMFREQARQLNPTKGLSPFGGSGALAPAPAPGEAITSTAIGPDGRGVELLILDNDPLDDEGFFLGDDPIDPQGE